MPILFNAFVLFVVLAWQLVYAEPGFEVREVNDFLQVAPILPSVDFYTAENAREKLTLYNKSGRAVRERMVENFELLKFYRNSKIKEWAKRQNDFPKAIFVRDGLITLEEIHRQNPKVLLKISAKVYLAKIPIVVSHSGGLLIDGGITLRLSQESGAFLINAGGLFVFDSIILAWKEADDKPAKYTGDKYLFRPFLSSFGGSSTYLINSYFESLGYQESKSYGISLLTYTKNTIRQAPEKTGVDITSSPHGWVVGSTFVDLYFGFYSYEAEDVVILENEYIDSVVYGIDPHDRSKRLIIANNIARGTQQKHGIIISREVRDCFIFGNISYDNARSGIVLDRSGDHNVIAGNRVFGNGGDGISLYESNHNLLWENQVYKNKEHGIRVRNSINISVQNNYILANGGVAVFFHTRDLSDHTWRDLLIDPYIRHVSGDVTGGVIGYNSSGAIYSENADYIRLSNLNMEFNGKVKGSPGLVGDLSYYQTDIMQKLAGGAEAIEFHPVGEKSLP